MKEILKKAGIITINGKIHRSQVEAAIQAIIASEKLELPADLHGYESMGDNSYYKELDRFSKYCDLDDHMDEHEIESLMQDDLERATKKYQSKLDNVNDTLKRAGYKPNAQFDLGEKGHFCIDFRLQKELTTDKIKTNTEKKGLFKVLNTDLKTLSKELSESILMIAGDFKMTMLDMNHKLFQKDYEESVTFLCQMKEKKGKKKGQLVIKVSCLNSLIHCTFLYDGEEGDPRVAAESIKAKDMKGLVNEIVTVANEAMTKKEKGVAIPF